jgi:DNA-directed RNA polymerase subunit RPC12/RpoP
MRRFQSRRLIGITIDNGSDVVLVSINEMFERSVKDASDEQQRYTAYSDDDCIQIFDDGEDNDDYKTSSYVREETMTDVGRQRARYGDSAMTNGQMIASEGYLDMKEVKMFKCGGLLAYDGQEDDGQITEVQGADGAFPALVSDVERGFACRQKGRQSRTVLDSATYENEARDDSTGDWGTEECEDGGAFYGEVDAKTGFSFVDEMQTKPRARRGNAGARQAARKLGSLTSRSLVNKACRRKKFVGDQQPKVEQFYDDSAGWHQDESSSFGESVPSGRSRGGGGSVEAAEVQYTAIYTCAVCGAQMSRLDSFKRHKKLHLDIVYRCDECGKVFNRRDTLTKHRRSCVNAQCDEPFAETG